MEWVIDLHDKYSAVLAAASRTVGIAYRREPHFSMANDQPPPVDEQAIYGLSQDGATNFVSVDFGKLPREFRGVLWTALTVDGEGKVGKNCDCARIILSDGTLKLLQKVRGLRVRDACHRKGLRGGRHGRINGTSRSSERQQQNQAANDVHQAPLPSVTAPLQRLLGCTSCI